MIPQKRQHYIVGWGRGDPLWFSLPAREEEEFGKKPSREEGAAAKRRTPLSHPLTWSTGRPIGGAARVPAANGKAARRAPRGYKRARAAESESGAAAAGAAAGSPARTSEPSRPIDGMLRTPEPRPGEAGAATQAKPLTSFLIQDILRDRTGGRPPRTPPLPPHQRPERRSPEPEPQAGSGGADPQEDEASPRPRAAPGEAESPAETEPGKPSGPRKPGRAGRGPAEGALACRLRGREDRSRAHPPELRQLRGCGARGDGEGASLCPAAGAPRGRTLSASGRRRRIDIGRTPRRMLRAPRAPGRGFKARAHAAPIVSPPPTSPPTHRPSETPPGPQPPRDCWSVPAPHDLLAFTLTNIPQVTDNHEYEEIRICPTKIPLLLPNHRSSKTINLGVPPGLRDI